MIRRPLPAALLCCLLLLACDGGSPPNRLEVSLGLLSTAIPASPTPQLTASPTPPPTITPVPAGYLEASALAAYMNEANSLVSEARAAEVDYLNNSGNVAEFADVFARRNDFIKVSDAFVVKLDDVLARYAKLLPPERARHYHDLTFARLSEVRSSTSDLRQGIANDSIDLWNSGVSRQEKINTLLKQQNAEYLLVVGYINANIGGR